MNYELDTLAAMVQLPEPSTKGISAITGISERKVRLVMDALTDEYDVRFEKERIDRSICYRIRSWGLFSPEALQEKLKAVDLVKVKASRIKRRKSAISTRETKVRAYKESVRLEGLEPAKLPIRLKDETRAQYKDRVITMVKQRAKVG